MLLGSGIVVEGEPQWTEAASAHIAAMARPEFYPDHPTTVERRETHISRVFLAGENVYKVKKPVRFPFIDCSTLERRRRLCFEEVRLNRRLAPGVYAGVHPIVAQNGGFALGPLMEDPADARDRGALEYAVRMTRLADERMLDRALARGADADEIRAVAGRIAEFHRIADGAKAELYGSAAAVAAMVADNLRQCERFEGRALSIAQMDGLAAYCAGFAGEHWELMNRRARDRRVVEGHGDLRCEHVYIDGGRIAIIDCVEFNEALRHGDVACDAGFLAMDLDRVGRHDMSLEFVAAYVDESGDREFSILLPYYECYRAAVRGKVAALRSVAAEIPAAERENALAEARDYFALACRYAGCYDGGRCAIVACGAAGSGKSTVARALAPRVGFQIVSSDETRKRMAGVSPETPMKARYGGGIYADDFTRRTYDALIAAGESILRGGAGVILDATFRHPEERRAAIAMAERAGAPILFVECSAGEDETIRRVRERAQRVGEVSDAGVEVYLRHRRDFVPLDEIAAARRMPADTTRPPREIARMIEARLALVCKTDVERKPRSKD